MLRPLAILCCAGLPLLIGCGTAAHAEDAYTRGVTALREGDRAAAAGWFRQATVQDPSLLEAHLNLAAIDLAEDRPQPALQRLESLRTADYAIDPRVRYLQAVALLRTEDTAAALDILRELDTEKFPEAAYLLGEQAMLTGDLGDAEGYFRRYLILRPEGGFGDEVQTHLSNLAELPVPDLESVTEPPADPVTEPDADPGTEVEPTPTDQAPVDTTPPPVVKEPVQPTEKPKAKPAPVPKADPPTEELTEDEKAWRDGRFLEIKKQEYGRAITAYRRYLQLAPFGEHASAAQEGIVRCEAALKAGDA